jgi:hypothetical protein
MSPTSDPSEMVRAERPATNGADPRDLGCDAAPDRSPCADGDGVLCSMSLPQGSTRTRWTRCSPEAHSSQLAPWSLDR